MTARKRLAIGAAVATLTIASTALAKLETWKQDTSSAFAKGHRERVIVSDNGRVCLGQALKPTAKLDAARVWDLARTPQGVTYAATGDAGKVYRRERADDAAWTLAYDASDTQALSLTVLPDGHVLLGTGPSGNVVDVSDPKHPSSRPDPSVQYIWDLAVDANGNVYAATGPHGQLWKRSPEGKWASILKSKHSHLLCVAVGPDGAVYTGSDGEGLVYRVARDGKISVVYDAPQSEVRTLLFAPDGMLYAGTAAESGGGSGSGRGPSLFSGGNTSFSPRGVDPERAVIIGGNKDHSGTFSPTLTFPAAPEPSKPPADPAAKPGVPRPPVGGSASPRPASPGENAVYRIDPDGVAREVFRARVLIFALAWQDDRLLVGTGPEGQIYEVREHGHESAPIARLDNGQALALLAEPQGGLLVGAGDPGAVLRLDPGHVASGSLVSDVFDTKLVSRFGTLSWRAEQPPGTSVTLQVRSGNVGEPDETWSAWSAEQATAEGSKPVVAPARFAQYRALLATNDSALTPELRSVSLRYQTANLAPEISKIEVPDVSAGDGATRQTRLTVRWDVSDPNDDEMNYTLRVRKNGWPDWVRLGETPLTDKSFSWDTTAVPAGLYRLRVRASDRPSNGPDDALTRERESEPFLVDHESPVVSLTPKSGGAAIVLKDELTRIAKAAYALDGGDWVAIFPDDGLFDSPRETITLSLPDLKPGTHILVVRAYDAAGNIGTGDALIEAR